MGATYLRHSKHGELIAYTPHEVNEAKSNGWVEYDAAAQSLPSFLATPPQDDVVEKLTEELKAVKAELKAAKAELEKKKLLRSTQSS